jgi:hypothetical protein
MRYIPLTLLLLSTCGTLATAGELDSKNVEVLLARSLDAVRNNHLDAALSEVDSILKRNPNFKLAHLVKGDLLLARARPISSFGNAPDAPRDRVEKLAPACKGCSRKSR